MKNKKFFCYSLGPNDFVYDKNFNRYCAVINNTWAREDSEVEVVISNWTFSYECFSSQNKLYITVPFKPKTNTAIKVALFE